MADGRTALVAGSFDPLTNGHLDVVLRARRLFDRVVVAVLVNPGKSPLLTLDERLALITESVAGAPGIEIVAFDGLLVDAATRHGASVVVRGLRSVTDYEHEWPMARMNAALLPGLETVYLPAAGEFAHVSSSLVRQIHAMGGSIGAFVPPAVLAHLRRRT
ncbi:pantetheine-phosphate adenylyltransferase [Luteitalea sp.]|jgi:pantetheine-phosphate adenylyltransferase|uniref:pantetheine-phosphate adenylyltransferase n=1 Tax=Luteitalea sp. TaxID=2004800 RepID=UPI000AF60060|nr:pantetheine-phosphate adenylyltransferase [Luteitalea sp.]